LWVAIAQIIGINTSTMVVADDWENCDPHTWQWTLLHLFTLAYYLLSLVFYVLATILVLFLLGNSMTSQFSFTYLIRHKFVV
jgi:hypothetical protein